MKHHVIRYLDLRADTKDMKAATLYALGQSNRFIEEATGLHPWQIAYRANASGIKGARTDYRNGASPIAKMVVKEHFDEVQDIVLSTPEVEQRNKKRNGAK